MWGSTVTRMAWVYMKVHEQKKEWRKMYVIRMFREDVLLKFETKCV